MSSMPYNSFPSFLQLLSDSLAFYCWLQVCSAQADQMISSCVCQVRRDLSAHLSSLLAHSHFMSEENMNIIEKCGVASREYVLLHEARRILAGELVLCLKLTVFRCKETGTKKLFTHLPFTLLLPALSRQHVSQHSSLTTWYSCRQVPLRHRGKK